VRQRRGVRCAVDVSAHLGWIRVYTQQMHAPLFPCRRRSYLERSHARPMQIMVARSWHERAVWDNETTTPSVDCRPIRLSIVGAVALLALALALAGIEQRIIPRRQHHGRVVIVIVIVTVASYFLLWLWLWL
jgi:hypothetical protein